MNKVYTCVESPIYFDVCLPVTSHPVKGLMSTDTPSSVDTSSFMRNYMAAQQSLYASIRAAGFSVTDADDVLQDVAVKLFESYASYNQERPFLPWALVVTKHAIYNTFRYNKVRSKMIVNSEVCQQIGDIINDELTNSCSKLEQEKEYLQCCMDELPEKSRTMISMRYFDEQGVKDIAEILGKTYASVNMTLSRIRSKLMDCVAARMSGIAQIKANGMASGRKETAS